MVGYARVGRGTVMAHDRLWLWLVRWSVVD